MEFSWITALKYFGLILTLGTAFVGSWFLEFTTTDKETGRKHFTPWGRRGIIFAALALGATLATTLWTDYNTAIKQQKAEALLVAERNRVIEYQQRSETAIGDIQKLLLGINSANLNSEEKATITQAVASLSGMEDYKKYYPDLYGRIMKSASFPDASQAIGEGLFKAVNGRISEESKCAGVPRPSKDIMSAYPSGNFMLGNSAGLSFVILPNGVALTFTDATDFNSLRGGKYSFAYADGTKSEEMRCTHGKPGMGCTDETSDPGVRAIYEQLRIKTIAAIKSEEKRYDVPSETGKKILTTFSCISP